MQHIPHHPLHGLHAYGKADGSMQVGPKDPTAALTRNPALTENPATIKQHPLYKIKMITGPLAMGLGYARSRDAGDSQLKSIGKALLLGFVSLPYLIYVGYDTYKA